MRSDSRRASEDLLPHARTADDVDAGACPDDDLVLGLVQGRLPEAVSEQIRAHLADCTTCRETAALLAEEDLVAEDRPVGADGVGRALRLPVLVLAAAAVVLVAFALQARRSAPSGPPDLDTRLVVAATALAETDPAHFADFVPLDEAERRAPNEGVRRSGGLELHRPRHRILDPRPSFGWSELAGAVTYQLGVFDAMGEEQWRRRATAATLPYPDDAAPLTHGATYLWEVSADGALGPMRGSATFEVASEEDARQFEEACRTIRETTPDPDLATLLEAHLAVRGGYLVHAWHVLADGEDDESVRSETRRYVARRLQITAE